MNREYKPSASLWAGRQCIEHIYNPDDIKLVGANGYLWKCRDGSFAAVVTSSLLINRYFGDKDYRYSSGQEKIIYFSRPDLESVIRRLKVPKCPKKQIELLEAYEGIETLKIEVASA